MAKDGSSISKTKVGGDLPIDILQSDHFSLIMAGVHVHSPRPIHATRNKTFAQEGKELIEAHRRKKSSVSDRETTLSWDNHGMPSLPSMEPTSIVTTENESTDQTLSETVATELADQGVATSLTELEDEQVQQIRDDPVEDKLNTSDDDLEMKHFKPVSYTHLTLPTNREV